MRKEKTPKQITEAQRFGQEYALREELRQARDRFASRFKHLAPLVEDDEPATLKEVGRLVWAVTKLVCLIAFTFFILSL